jgi:hypothetical protein
VGPATSDAQDFDPVMLCYLAARRDRVDARRQMAKVGSIPFAGPG